MRNFVILSLAAFLVVIGIGCGKKEAASVPTVTTPTIKEAIVATINKPGVEPVLISATSTTSTTVVTRKPVAKKVATTVKAVPVPLKPKYEQVFKSYIRIGYRIQINNCSAAPGRFTLKKGSKIMIDNRDNKAHTITVGKQRLSLERFGYTVITAQTLGTNNITCDGGGAGSLTVVP